MIKKGFLKVNAYRFNLLYLNSTLTAEINVEVTIFITFRTLICKIKNYQHFLHT